MMYIGVDLGGTGIKAGVVNEQGEILSKGSTPTMKERPLLLQSLSPPTERRRTR